VISINPQKNARIFVPITCSKRHFISLNIYHHYGERVINDAIQKSQIHGIHGSLELWHLLQILAFCKVRHDFSRAALSCQNPHISAVKTVSVTPWT